MNSTDDKRKIWQVKELDNRGYVEQIRYVPASSRKEAKDIYSRNHKKYPSSRLTAFVVGWHMSEWVGEEVQT